MCFNRDAKDNLIEFDGELHSLACYCFSKKIAIVEIKVVVYVTSLITSSGSICASSSSSSTSSVGGGGGLVIARKSYKFDFWARNFDGGVGQRFALGAPEFHCKLIEYSIVSGYKYKLIKNDEFKVTAVCENKNEGNCEWCIYSCDTYGSFEIKKINLTHTYGFAFKDYNHLPLKTYLVMTHILDFVRDKLFLSLGYITSFYCREYGLKISKHLSYAGKKLALTKLYGDVTLSYNELLWYTKELKRRDPGNCVDLQVNEESGKFERVFVAFESKILPPDVKRALSIPQVKRIESTGVMRYSAHKCRKCHKTDLHGRKTCRGKTFDTADVESRVRDELPSGSGDMILRSWQFFDVGSTSEAV
ncbi:hypothetical protein IFM89_016079 [Coptis chinensis]|uniref:Transposase MuDR plant domain-containing protein n=1 Tax=Coptis chinensis TaxID=261450 RepID=A0A835M6H9_9MAGN|nr:hypothetical protein IFM89_016079 [Coptis chinensis]